MARLKIYACSNDAVAVKVKEDLKQSGIPENKIKIRVTIQRVLAKNIICVKKRLICIFRLYYGNTTCG